MTHDMPLFQIIPAKRVYCYQIAWQLPNEQREAMISLGLRPFRFTAQAGLEQLAANEAGPAAELAEEGGALQGGAGLLGSALSVSFKFAGLPSGSSSPGHRSIRSVVDIIEPLRVTMSKAMLAYAIGFTRGIRE